MSKATEAVSDMFKFENTNIPSELKNLVSIKLTFNPDNLKKFIKKYLTVEEMAKALGVGPTLQRNVLMNMMVNKLVDI